MQERLPMMLDDLFVAGALVLGLATMLTTGVGIYIWKDSRGNW